MTWSKEWPNTFTIADVQRAKDWLSENDSNPVTPIVYIDPINDLVSKTIIDSNKETVTIREVYKVRNNKVPTHDPYTNPDAHIYYQCNCGAILDPGTKSFAALNNAAMASGWKIRFGHEYYVPYCVKCGEGVD